VSLNAKKQLCSELVPLLARLIKVEFLAIIRYFHISASVLSKCSQSVDCRSFREFNFFLFILFPVYFISIRLAFIFLSARTLEPLKN
jgi:hypothetical protein